jgi:glycosyltransferase involved in cell wall biosynthesis
MFQGVANMIDILLATYNGQTYLREQIDSILAQSNQDWQLLIRDDGSNDDTLSIIEDYVARYSGKIKLIENGNCHLGAKLNFERLMDHSTSEYLAFCDQDDVWLSNKIEETLQLMQETEREHPGKAVLIHTDLRVVDSELSTIAESTWQYQGTPPETGNNYEKVKYQNVATGCTMMINKKAKEISLPIPEEAVMHDWWIIMKVAKHGRVAYVPDQLVLYRQHANNVVGAKEAPRKNFLYWLGELFCLGPGKILYYYRRLINHYRMVKKEDPNARFFVVASKKIYYEIARKLRQ